MASRNSVRTLTVVALTAVAGAQTAVAAPISLTADASVYSQNFDTFNGTAVSSVSATGEWTVGAGAYRGTFTSGPAGDAGTSIYSGSVNDLPGYYALNDNDALADDAIGVKTANGNTLTVTGTFKNDTGQVINQVDIGYAFEQFSAGSGASTLNVTWSLNGVSAGTTGLTGATALSAAVNAPGRVVYTDPARSLQAVTLTSDIPAGATFAFVFTWTAPGSGTRAHLGVDDFTLAAVVPEPAALGALGTAGAAAALRRRRAR